MLLNKTSYLSLMVIFVAGCSTINYNEPTAGELSRVRFATDHSEPVVVRAYENSRCDGENEWMRLRNGILLNSSPKTLDMPLSDHHKNAFKEFYVSSESKKVLMFVGTQTYTTSIFTCGVPLGLSFLEKNKDFELFYQYKGDGCTVVASELVTLASGEVSRNIINTYTSNASKFGKECIDAFKKYRLY